MVCVCLSSVRVPLLPWLPNKCIQEDGTHLEAVNFGSMTFFSWVDLRFPNVIPCKFLVNYNLWLKHRFICWGNCIIRIVPNEDIVKVFGFCKKKLCLPKQKRREKSVGFSACVKDWGNLQFLQEQQRRPETWDTKVGKVKSHKSSVPECLTNFPRAPILRTIEWSLFLNISIVLLSWSPIFGGKSFPLWLSTLSFLLSPFSTR